LVAIATNVKHYHQMSKNNKSARKILQLERYLPYRLSILSNRISALISETYSAKFALSITEWRIMAVLGEYPGVSADEVSLKTQIEKSILSRAISKLLQRKLLERAFDPADKRRSMLRLTETGLSVYDELVPMSYDYEQELLTCFSDTERQQFSELIDRLYEHAEKSN
jgi:DNA-binding MarR family transcriptional regulator